MMLERHIQQQQQVLEQTFTLDPTGVTAFTKAVKVGSGTTITLGTTANDVNIVTLGVHYNGGTNTDAANYNVFITKSGDFR